MVETSPVVFGIGIGLTLALLIGPVFFALLQTSLEKGFLAGFFLSIGIAASDAVYIFLTNFSVSEISNLADVEFSLGIFGGVFLIGFGVRTFFKKTSIKTQATTIKMRKRNYLWLTLKGFILNGINPGVLIFWLGVVSLVTFKTGYEKSQADVVYCSIIVTVFMTDLLKSFLASLIKRFITPNVLKWINRGVGVVLFGIGIGMLIKTL
jgi:threonine/homoserine/homoserine lactone efflux protein